MVAYIINIILLETDPHYKSYAAKRTEAIEREEARSYSTERKSDTYYPEEKGS